MMKNCKFVSISSNSCIPTQQYKHLQFVLTYYVSIAKYALRIFLLSESKIVIGSHSNNIIIIKFDDQKISISDLYDY